MVTAVDERGGRDAVGVHGVVERGDRAHAVPPRREQVDCPGGQGQGTGGRLHGNALGVVSVCVDLLLLRDVRGERRGLGVYGHSMMRVCVAVGA